jgi:hypothetical protein
MSEYPFNDDMAANRRIYEEGLRQHEIQSNAQSRRELAEKILLKLIEISAAFATLPDANNEGVKLAWQIADAFLKAENP